MNDQDMFDVDHPVDHVYGPNDQFMDYDSLRANADVIVRWRLWLAQSLNEAEVRLDLSGSLPSAGDPFDA